jgi:NADPH:quinone reductase-like Zn-dependent oxidoreductase
MSRSTPPLATVTDAVLEASVIGSFSAIGPRVRGRLQHWGPAVGDLHGRTYVVTGATSGIGRAAATMLSAAGARVFVTGRDSARTVQAATEITAAADSSEPGVEPIAADMGELDQVRAAVEVIAS